METRIKQYNKAIQNLHEAKMKQISVNYSGIVTELVLMVVMGVALVTLLFI